MFLWHIWHRWLVLRTVAVPVLPVCHTLALKLDVWSDGCSCIVDVQQEILITEKVLVEGLRFDLLVELPYPHLLKFIKLLQGCLLLVDVVHSCLKWFLAHLISTVIIIVRFIRIICILFLNHTCICYFIIVMKSETYAAISRQHKIFSKIIERARTAKTRERPIGLSVYRLSIYRHLIWISNYRLIS